MSATRPIKRLVVLVDGSGKVKDSNTKNETNPSNIERIHQLIREGQIESNGRRIAQIAKYYVAGGHASKLSDLWKSKSKSAAGDETADLIKNIVKTVCTTLEQPQDELWLYGSGHGAFVVRAVAGIVHRLGLPNTSAFDDLYEATLGLIKAQLEDDYRRGPQLLQQIKSQASGPPRIPFVGLFDAVQAVSAPGANTSYDLSFNPSITALRHAMAMNENRSSRTLEGCTVPNDTDIAHRSLIQAWFLGTHDDMCGGTSQDGLSLYPLQWMVLETLAAGLDLLSTGDSKGIMALIFPQYAGNLPRLDGSEEIEWCLKYTNGIEFSIFDIQTTHAKRSTAGTEPHAIKLNTDRFKHSSNRKIFRSNGVLRDWNAKQPHGTVIHPSLFCILDRYPRYLEFQSLRHLRFPISNFQDTYLVANEGSLAPWLRDMQLQANGVKAFRILVCGKTGVGKSTLINKVFGVEMTDESLSYDQGVHDINVAFESPKHPGLLIHDSRGWQAGSDTELDLIAKFLRHRAFQEDPAEALHVIWFCVDADVARIEEADKRTFATIAQFSHQVPVFVVGTKKDKLTGYRKMQYLEEFMEKMDDYKEAKKLAEEKANQVADAQFAELRNQLSLIEHYKADGFCCLSKNDDVGIKDLLSQTLGLIVDERVRIFCVAAQVVDVEQKINAAITECMRLGTHAIRTAAVPLPCSGLIGTPTVSRLIVESVLQCFGFPKAAPAEVERIMSDIVMQNLKTYLKVSLTQFAAVSAVAVGIAVPTMGIGVVAGAAGCMLGLPPTARMLLKCSCDMILILERSFRYDGKYVSTKQIEDAARYYAKTTITTFSGKEKRLQQRVHDEIDRLIPLKNLTVCFKFNKLRTSVEEIIYSNRFGNPSEFNALRSASTLALTNSQTAPVELDAGTYVQEMPADTGTAQFQSYYGEDKTIKSDHSAPETISEMDSNEGLPWGGLRHQVSGLTLTSAPDHTSNTSTLITEKIEEHRLGPAELNGDTGQSPTELDGAPLAHRTKSETSTASRWTNKFSWKMGRRSKTTKE